MSHEKFDEIIRAKWDNNAPLIPFLKQFGDFLSGWNREVFHNIFRKKSKLWARLEGIQKKLALRRDRHLIKLEASLHREMDDVLNQEEMLWFQKSSVEAIPDGDRNTRYFHLSTIMRRRRNRIETLQDGDGNWIQCPNRVKSMVVNFFDCEIKRVLMGMKPVKAPGPDSIQPLFYQQYWDLVTPGVINLVKDVLEDRAFLKGLNDEYLVIINRLKPLLPTLISPTQCSFVPQRQITDNIIIVQEMLHIVRHKQGKIGLMAMKIDFEKAYDRLCRSFIRESLLELRLPQAMVDVVMNCVSSAKLQILWNGEPTRSFTPSQGIRQEDPLSPYLYVICMERLAYLIEHEVKLVAWKAARASRRGPDISHLAFADDLILFCEASVEQAMCMKRCLDKFCAASSF
ncbi:uncharacterized protein LOC110696708 [Chenopodium quinoa]|uniref:uncharacterized protein LOC110696708 n=1 Tax=Chenopodium quinoa TaxID=63459 RepID=UPI000B793C2C|nr:uncharacterized protein LOC110696708 [Chenopodium quinoa]